MSQGTGTDKRLCCTIFILVPGRVGDLYEDGAPGGHRQIHLQAEIGATQVDCARCSPVQHDESMTIREMGMDGSYKKS